MAKTKPTKNEEESDDDVKIYLPGDESEAEAEIDQAIEDLSSEGEASSEEDSDTEAVDAFEQNDSEIQLKKTKDEEKLMKNIKKAAKVKHTPATTRGVIYLARIPHGFYEQEMTGYFSQFGTVTRLRLSRNKKTGASKHYAFIEFENIEVAKIVCETMDNYLLMNHLLACKLVPAEKVHDNIFKGSEKPFKALPWNKIERQRHNKEKTKEEKEKNAKRAVAKLEKKRKELADKGIEYDFPTSSPKKQKVAAKAEKTKPAKKGKKAEKEAVEEIKPVKKDDAKPSKKVTKAAKAEKEVVEETKPFKKATKEVIVEETKSVKKTTKAKAEKEVVEETKPVKKATKASKAKAEKEVVVEETKPVKKAAKASKANAEKEVVVEETKPVKKTKVVKSKIVVEVASPSTKEVAKPKKDETKAPKKAAKVETPESTRKTRSAAKTTDSPLAKKPAKKSEKVSKKSKAKK